MNRRELFIGAGAVALATTLPALPALAEQAAPTLDQIYALASDDDILRNVLFEFNDTLTRHELMKYINTKLGPCNDNWHMVCDDSNNTFDVIADNDLVVDFYVKNDLPEHSLSHYRIRWGQECVACSVMCSSLKI